MQFLLDYYLYFENIESNSYVDDLNLSNKFKKQSKNNKLIMKEGLITTHPLNKSIEIINNRFSEILAKADEDGEIYIEGKFNELFKYTPLFNNLGYFISLISLDGKSWIGEYEDDSKPVAIVLEAKYDIKIDKKNIPTMLKSK